MQNVRIKELAVYHPEKVVDNEYYINHFKEKGRDITKFLQMMGRDKRYIIDNERENTLTMGIEAAKKVLEKAGLTGQDMDMIVFSTQVPEYTFPTNAVRLHDAIQGNASSVVYDMNGNCAGMTIALEQVSRYMVGNPRIRRALIVGSDYYSLIADPDTEITYACVGDAAAAMILEATNEETGFIDASYHINTAPHENISYPAEGLSKGLTGKGTVDYIKWLPFDASESLPETFAMLDDLFTRNNVDRTTIKCCFSQFALVNIQKIQENYGFANEQMIIVGDKFGYTGTSSPLIALHEAVEKGEIKRGDTVLFWTIGTGYQLVSMLFKY